MEWDFRYLQGKYGDAGARAKFEEICHALLLKLYPEQAHSIRVEQGDGIKKDAARVHRNSCGC